MNRSVCLPVALTVAGSDSGGGAGIQADLLTFSVMGLHGTSAITAVTAQNSLGVVSIHRVPPETVRDQIAAVFADFPVAAVKTGMLPTAGIVSVVAEEMRGHPGVPLVVDPVVRSTSGADLQERDAVRVMKDELFPLATVITPNGAEAALFSGTPVRAVSDFRAAAETLLDTGCRWLLVTGGDQGGDLSTDVLISRNECFEFPGKRVDTEHTHGSGCVFSAALAARLAQGDSVPDAVKRGKWFITEAIRNGMPLGAGRGAVRPAFGVTPPEAPE